MIFLRINEVFNWSDLLRRKRRRGEISSEKADQSTRLRRGLDMWQQRDTRDILRNTCACVTISRGTLDLKPLPYVDHQ